MKLSADVDASKVIQKLADLKGEIREELTDTLNETVINIERKAKRNVKNNGDDTGRLASSIHAEPVRNKAKPFASVEVSARYGPFVEFGTKSKVDIPAGLESYAAQFKSSGGNFDNLLKNIKQWCKNKGIPEEAAYPIAVKIAREGVGAQPFLFPAYFSELPKLRKRLTGMIRETV